jgi:hypothetical protein
VHVRSLWIALFAVGMMRLACVFLANMRKDSMCMSCTFYHRVELPVGLLAFLTQRLPAGSVSLLPCGVFQDVMKP